MTPYSGYLPYLCHMKQLITFFIILFLSGCNRNEPVSDLFRWDKQNAQADSLTVALEWAFIERDSYACISGLIARLDSATKSKYNRESADVLFWKARLQNREHHTAEAKKLLSEALARCDSSSRPYAFSRMKYLNSIISRISKGKLHSALKEYEQFYRSTDDPFMTATASVDLGHIMREVGDRKRGLAYYLYADSLYEALGVDTYHLKTSLNNASIFAEAGDSARSRSLLRNLIDNPKAKADRDFYINVLIDNWKICGDTTALISAWLLTNERGLNLIDSHTTALEMCSYLLGKGKISEAEKLCLETIKKFTPNYPLTIKAQAYKLLADIYESKGETARALTNCKIHSKLQDSLLKVHSAIEIGNIESRGEIARSEAEMESRHQIERLWTWIFVMALLMGALLVAFILMRKVQASRLSIARYHLDLEKERRSLVSSALVMEEKDNVLKSVLSDIHKMESEGKLKPEETRHLEQNVKMHLSGRQDWDHFRELFDNVHPMFHKRLKADYPELTEGDLRLATYIKVGMQGKQIARMLMLQPDTIRKNRQKLRRHLRLESEESLEDFLRTIDS